MFQFEKTTCCGNCKTVSLSLGVNYYTQYKCVLTCFSTQSTH